MRNRFAILGMICVLFGSSCEGTDFFASSKSSPAKGIVYKTVSPGLPPVAETATVANAQTSSDVAPVAAGSAEACLAGTGSDNDAVLSLTGGDSLFADVRRPIADDEGDAVSIMTRRGLDWYGLAGCSPKAIAFRVGGEDGAYFEGILKRSDRELFAKGVISAAELGRRVEVRRMETLASVKRKLAEARAVGDHGYAMTLVGRWLEEEPENAVAKLIKANVQLAKKDFAPAAELYETILAGDSGHFTAWFNLAFAKRELGLFDEAAAIYDKLLAAFDTFPEKLVTRDELLAHLADTRLANNDVAGAEAALLQIQDKNNPVARQLLAAILRAQKKFKEAKETLEAMLKLDGGDPLARFNLVLAFLDLQDAEGARKAYEELKVRAPSYAEELRFINVLNPRPLPAAPEDADE